ncbi:MAG: OmpA family protein [Saprospiraceae bacterium]|nr:OmpA family protein [Saprospiraceae bacterium]
MIRFLFIAVAFCSPFFLLAQQDCEDHPLIERFPKTTLEWCETQSFGSYHIAVGPQTGYKNIDDWVDVEGKIYRLYYILKGQASVSEVYQNYRNELKRSEFEILANGAFPQRNVKKEVGGNTWMGTAYAKNPYPINSGVQLFHGSSDSGGMGYIAAKLQRPDLTAYAVIAAYQHHADEVLICIDIIEQEALRDNQVQVNTDYLARELQEKGTVSIYGIEFEYDKYDLLPASKPILKVIADFLQQQKNINLYVIGHTDMRGTLTYNLTLSEKRAQAVVDYLVSKHGIRRDRLEGKGVGPLAPKSTNETETGRQLNRRVELVKKVK